MFHVCMYLTPSLLLEKAEFLLIPTVIICGDNHLGDSFQILVSSQLAKVDEILILSLCIHNFIGCNLLNTVTAMLQYISQLTTFCKGQVLILELLLSIYSNHQTAWLTPYNKSDSDIFEFEILHHFTFFQGRFSITIYSQLQLGVDIIIDINQ